MTGLQWAGTILGGLFTLCYAYQIVYLFVPLFTKEKTPPHATLRRLAVLIAARNEQAVIGQLLDSIRQQDYPAGQLCVAVVADNCTDDTAAIARQHGAVVFERQDTRQVGKGFALQFLLQQLELCEAPFDAYLVLDADNLLAPGYLSAMSDTLAAGYDIVTGYRNAKNYGDNWISAGYALWFLRESQYLNRSRHRLGTSCMVSGTGFAFSRRILERNGGWPFHCLTEDIEFSVVMACEGERIGYCRQAVLYDEQPVTFVQSWKQRLRWAKGNFQVIAANGGRLLQGAAAGRMACFDALCCTMPAFVLSMAGLVLNLADLCVRLVTQQPLIPVFAGMLRGTAGAYGMLLVLGLFPLLSEWRYIAAPGWKKVLHLFTFPLFMFTYIPIAVAALFGRVEWTPVAHTRAMTVEEICDAE